MSLQLQLFKLYRCGRTSVIKMSQNIVPTNTPSRKSPGEKTPSSKNNHSVTKRLQSELKKCMMSGNKEISAFPDGDNLFKWIGTIHGPSETVYENLIFKLSMTFPSNYPFSAPVVKFKTKIFHPNVDKEGNICLDILKEQWSASYDVNSILLSIQSLLGEPNNDSPLNGQAAEMWKNAVAFRKKVLEEHDGEKQK